MMNQAEVSSLLCVGLHETDGGEESYATECPKMNQDSSHETTKFDVVMSTSAMYKDHSDANACLDEYQHTGMMAGVQPMEEIRFDSTQHFELQSQGIVPDSEEESFSSSPETLSTANYDMPGYMEQNLHNIYNALDEMVDKDGPVMLNPEFVMCDTTLHLEPHLTFSSDGFKIEYLDWDSCEDDEMMGLHWEISDIICIGCKWTQSVGSALITLLVGSGAETGNSGPVRVQFCLTDLQWPRKQQKIWHLASRYQEIWNNIPSDDFVSENWSIEPSLFFPRQYFSETEDFEDVIYPKGDPDAVSISKRDVELLLPETFVNDTIIDFYIKFLSTRIEPTEKRRYHFFNSFFFRKLADLDKDQGRAPEGRAAFLRVRKWTRKINLFEKDFLFIPVNFNLHWSLIVICYPGEVETFEDGDTKISAKVPCILHMDSLKGSHSGLKDIIQSYLWEEWKERYPESASDNSDKFLNLRFVSLELPQQDNSFDCGLFLLHYVELFLMDAPSSFNPLKIDVFSSFLSDDWFPPAEASLKRSLIRKLIHGLVTEPSQNYPKLTVSNEQLDEKHQRSENAEREPAREFLAQRCSAGEPDSVCAILGTQQPSTSICLNDSEEKVVPASGCILETGSVSMVAAQNLPELGVCPPDKDTVVCLSSQDEKNEPPLAGSDNQLDVRSCTPEDAEVLKGSGCLVKDKNAHEEPLLDSLDKNQKISNQPENIAKEVVACQEHSLERNTNEANEVEDERCGASQDMHSVMMLDASKDDMGPSPERSTGEAEDGRCDLFEDMDSVTIDDINKDVAERSLERNIVEAGDTKCEDTLVDPITVEDAIKDSMKKTSTAVDEINDSEQYVSSELKKGNTDNGMTSGSAVSSELKEENAVNVMAGGSTNATDETHADGEDALVDPITVEDAIKDNMKKTSTAVDEINDSEQYVSSELKKGNTDNGMTSGCAVSSELKEENAVNVMAGGSTNATDETHADGEDALVDPITVEDAIKDNMKKTSTAVDEINDSEQYVSSELKKGNTDNGMTSGSAVSSELKEENAVNVMAGGSSNATDETHADGEDALVDPITVEDAIKDNMKKTSTAVDEINDSEQYVSSELKKGNTDNGMTSGSAVSSELKEENAVNVMAGGSTNATDETHADGEDAYVNLVTGEAVPCEDDTACTDAEMPLVDGTCSAKNETISKNTTSDAKRPLPDSSCEENDIVVSDDTCLQKDVQGTGAKIERHYKRRKVVPSEVDKRHTRSTSRAPSSD